MGLTGLNAILEARERRRARQQALLARFGRPLICFTLNIAGPEKNSPLIAEGFRLGSSLLRDQLRALGLPLLHREELDLPTGWEGYYVAPAPADTLKELTTALEDSLPVGRLFDMDVLDVEGQKLGRTEPRRCLLCDQPAALCGRSRAHSVEALQQRTRALLREAVRQRDARDIGRLATRSLLWEVCVTPKPGLVDRNNSGSHRDMDIFTFMDSTAALAPYFEDCARIGMETAALPPAETFARLRLRGRTAEGEMGRATAGVNTHKGAIFTLGLLCGACGRTGRRDPAAICAACAEMTRGLTRRELEEAPPCSAGQRIFVRHGLTGVRGQAEAGFPALLQTGLPTLRQGLAQGLRPNDAGARTLLALLCVAEDTNIIARSGPETLTRLRTELGALLEAGPDEAALRRLDREFIAQNLSPGGSADLLAATFFLHFLQEAPPE